MLNSGHPESQTSPNPGFVACPVLHMPPSRMETWQEMYRWAFALAQAQVAAHRTEAMQVSFDPSWN